MRRQGVARGDTATQAAPTPGGKNFPRRQKTPLKWTTTVLPAPQASTPTPHPSNRLLSCCCLKGRSRKFHVLREAQLTTSGRRKLATTSPTWGRKWPPPPPPATLDQCFPEFPRTEVPETTRRPGTTLPRMPRRTPSTARSHYLDLLNSTEFRKRAKATGYLPLPGAQVLGATGSVWTVLPAVR